MTQVTEAPKLERAWWVGGFERNRVVWCGGEENLASDNISERSSSWVIQSCLDFLLGALGTYEGCEARKWLDQICVWGKPRQHEAHLLGKAGIAYLIVPELN